MTSADNYPGGGGGPIYRPLYLLNMELVVSNPVGSIAACFTSMDFLGPDLKQKIFRERLLSSSVVSNGVTRTVF